MQILLSLVHENTSLYFIDSSVVLRVGDTLRRIARLSSIFLFSDSTLFFRLWLLAPGLEVMILDAVMMNVIRIHKNGYSQSNLQ